MAALLHLHRREYESLFSQGRPVLLVLSATPSGTASLRKDLHALGAAVGDGACLAVGDLGADPAFAEVLNLAYEPLLKLGLGSGLHLVRVIKGGVVVHQTLAASLQASALGRELLEG
jgi:hypothetical protein